LSFATTVTISITKITAHTLTPTPTCAKDNGGNDKCHPDDPFDFDGMLLAPGDGGVAQVRQVLEGSQANSLNVLVGSTILAVNAVALANSNVSSVRNLLLAQVRDLSADDGDQSIMARFSKLTTDATKPKLVEITIRFNQQGVDVPRYLRYDILEMTTESEQLKCCVAGLVACNLPKDDGCKGQWCLQFLRTLVVDILMLPEAKIEAYAPLLWAFNTAKAQPDPFLENVIGLDNRRVLLKDLFVVSFSSLNYDARCRSMLRAVASSLGVDWKDTFSLIEMSLAASLAKELNNLHNLKHEKKKMTVARGAKIGLAAVTGATVLVLTAGIAAPLIAGGFVALGAAGTGAALATGAGYAAMLTLFGTGGAGLMGYKMNRRTSGVQVFNFHKLIQGDMCPGGTASGSSQRSSEEWKAMFTTFYRKHNPEKVDSVGSLLLKYPGEEEMLWKTMHKKYAQNLPANCDATTMMPANYDESSSSASSSTGDVSPPDSLVASSNSLHVVICVTGWLTSSIDFHSAWGGKTYAHRPDGEGETLGSEESSGGASSEGQAPPTESQVAKLTRGASDSVTKV
jgi:hypothetical protein